MSARAIASSPAASVRAKPSPLGTTRLHAAADEVVEPCSAGQPGCSSEHLYGAWRSNVETPGRAKATTACRSWPKIDVGWLSAIWCTVSARYTHLSMDTVAGIRIPDSALAKDAHELAHELSPDFLMGHVDRTFVFGSLATQATGLEVDEEIA